MAARYVNAPVALVSLVDDQRQFFKSAVGLGEPWASRRETPLSHSFCQYVTRDRAPLVVSDAREHPVLRDNLAVRDLQVIAYAGFPLVIHDEPIGVFCVVDTRPRTWSEEELAMVADLAESVVSEIELRIAVRAERDQRALTQTLLESLGDGVLAIDTQRRFILANAAARRLFAVGLEVGATLTPEWTALHRSARADGTRLAPEDGALARGLLGEETNGLEFTLERPGAAGPVWVEASGRPVRGPDGDVIAAVATYRDVTERKQRVDLYTTLAANIPHAAVVLFDAELRCQAVDGDLARADGAGRGEAIGRSMRELAGVGAGGAGFDLVEAAYRRTLAGHALTLDYTNRGRTLVLRTAPVRDARGHVTSGIVLALDVSDQSRAQAALRRSEQIYRAIVQSLPRGAVFMVDANLRYLSADGPALPALMATAMVPYDDLVGHTVAEVVSEANREATETMLRATLAGAAQRLEIRRGGHGYELVAEPLVDEATGAITSALLFCFDVTERQLAEDAGARDRSYLTQFRAFVEHLPSGISVIRGGTIAYVNPAMVRILGHEDGSTLVGRSVLEAFIHPDDRGAVGARILAAETEAVVPRRTRCLRHDGSTVVLETMGRPFEFDGAPAVIAVSRDLTDELKLEAVRARALAEKTAMLQEIHHRVKNNLQMISSLLNLQARQIQDPAARATFLDTQHRVRSIALLHDNLYQSDDLGHVDMRGYIEKLVATLRRAYGESSAGASFVVSVGEIVLPLDAAVPCGLIVNELVTNALKHAFTDTATVAGNEIRIEVRRAVGEIVILVADSGPGFAATVNPTTNETLGLSLVRDLSRQLRGEVTFANDHGARCTVRFPAPGGAGGVK